MFASENNSNTKTFTTIKPTIGKTASGNEYSPFRSQKFSIFNYILQFLCYILIIYLVSYIVLTILNQLNLLPYWLKKIFSENKNVKNNTQEQNLATSIQKDDPRPESIPPTPLPQEGNPLPKPDLSTSTTQSSKIANKSGYCYIGEDRGFRSCIKVKHGDKCMSGNIFPTEAMCINPNLRP